jgi:hypothetical protein
MNIRDYRDYMFLGIFFILIGIALSMFADADSLDRYIVIGVFAFSALAVISLFVGIDYMNYVKEGRVNYYIANHSFMIRISRSGDNAELRNVIMVNNPAFEFKRRFGGCSVRDTTSKDTTRIHFLGKWEDMKTHTKIFKNDKEALLWYKLNY